jgi:hypothetical protein
MSLFSSITIKVFESVDNRRFVWLSFCKSRLSLVVLSRRCLLCYRAITRCFVNENTFFLLFPTIFGFSHYRLLITIVVESVRTSEWRDDDDLLFQLFFFLYQSDKIVSFCWKNFHYKFYFHCKI